MEPSVDATIQPPALIAIPAGQYAIGLSRRMLRRLLAEIDLAKSWAEKGLFGREQPTFKVWLNPFAISRYPVTVGAYRAFVNSDGYGTAGYWDQAGWQWLQKSARIEPTGWTNPDLAGDDGLPVVGISWYEARAYCRWLAEAIGKEYRLPTEFEWEAAARGQGDRLFPWGDTFDADRCNSAARGVGKPLPAGSFSPEGDSPWGCADMAGNVSEWTASRFRLYPVDGSDLIGEANGAGLWVTRGGSWHSNPLRVRTTSRGYNDPWFSDSDLGFRLACDM